jgi:hypothetical protein
MQEEKLTGFGRAVAKGEGMVADPDEFVWGCDCEKCKSRYNKWKKLFDEQQKEVRGSND